MKRKHTIALAIQATLAAAVLGGLIYGNVFAASYDNVLDAFFGRVGRQVPIGEYKTEHDSKEALLKDYRDNFNYEVAKEGSVLLKNDANGLPLARQSKISVFGASNVCWMEREKIPGGIKATFLNGLRDAFQVNGELRRFYLTNPHTDWGVGDNKGDGTKPGSWKIDEAAKTEYDDALKSTFPDYSDAAIVVLSRSSGEGADLPRHMDRFGGGKDEHYLQLSKEERDIFEMIKEAGCFKKTIVILHTNNPMQLDFLKDYEVNALISIAGTGEGEKAVEGIVELLTGDANFSGRLVDTYCYDNLSSPAMKNFGDFRYVDNNGNLTGNSYINLAEGIYVGYKYYETRYVDKMKNAANVGDFDYDATVAYPFGYGLSYTEFSYGATKGAYYAPNDEITLSVDVTNSGQMAGKEVVEFYMESPYTDYDKAKGIEKSAVSLIGYDKTAELKPNEKAKINVTIPRRYLSAFDKNGSGTYVLEKGEYRFTAAKNAHEAANHFLSGTNVYQYVVEQDDFLTYSVSKAGEEIKPLFDSATLEDGTYLSRSNWQAMEKEGFTYATGEKEGVSETTDAAKKVFTHPVDDARNSRLKASGWESSGNPNKKEDYPEVTYDAHNGVEFKDAVGKSFDDPVFDELLDNLSFEEAYNVYKNSANGTARMASIAKASTFGYDGPEGFSHKTGGAEMMIASTYNRELIRRYGELNGEYGLLNGYTAWYAPGMNLHRTPFSGRNYEYVAEDSFLTGDFVTNVVSASAKKGVICVPKHFALNEQETNRQGNGMVATYAREQAIRETYLFPFQMVVESGNCLGMMSSMNRIGDIPARANYALNVEVLRQEWGFKGFLITDYNNISPLDSEACLAGGITVQLAGKENPLSETSSKGARYLLRQSMHHMLYSLLQSNAAAGLLEGQPSSEGVKVYVLMLAGIDAVVLLLALSGVGLSFARYRNKDKEVVNAVVLKRINVASIIHLVILVAVVIAALVIFFVYGLPLLQYAFNIA